MAKEYLVIMQPTIDELQKEVMKSLAAGYNLLGGVSTMYVPYSASRPQYEPSAYHGQAFYLQAMTKEKNPR